MNAQHKQGLFATGSVDAFAIAAPGLAPLVASELREIGIVASDVSDAGVAFKGSALDVFRANLWSRIASRILVRMAVFTARDFRALEKESRMVPWANVVAAGATVRLRVTCRKSRLYHSDAVAERIASSIMRRVEGAEVVLRASDEEELTVPSQLIVARIERDVCTISADTSGELLHRRGWRQAVARAPLRETLAAAMLRACGWSGQSALADPFCGSGTIGIEAALLARNIAPGLGRSFAMEQFRGVDERLVLQERTDARSSARSVVGVPIVLSDRDAGAIEAARQNAERAGVAGAARGTDLWRHRHGGVGGGSGWRG